MTTPFPPVVHHNTARISPSSARALLSTFLQAATEDQSLHPNAILTENGPVTPSSGEGVVLHNLHRLEAGLKGEYVAAELRTKVGRELSEGGQLGVSELGDTGEKGARKVAAVEMEGEWQDRGEWEREQEPVEGEIGVRDRAFVGKGEETVGSPVDKDARKRAKKERLKMERREKAEQKKREKNAEG